MPADTTIVLRIKNFFCSLSCHKENFAKKFSAIFLSFSIDMQGTEGSYSREH